MKLLSAYIPYTEIHPYSHSVCTLAVRRVGEWGSASFSNPTIASPTSQLILQPILRFTYVTSHSPTFLLLHLRNSSFLNPSVALPTSQALHLRHLASRPWYLLFYDKIRGLINKDRLRLSCSCLDSYLSVPWIFEKSGVSCIMSKGGSTRLLISW